MSVLRSVESRADPDVSEYLREVLELVERGEVTGFTLIAQRKPVGEEPARLSYWTAGLKDRMQVVGCIYMLLQDVSVT